MTESRENQKESDDAQMQTHSVLETILGHDLTKENKKHGLGR